jgi:prevent-host-death family protein
MKIANMHAAKSQLSSLVEDALAGEEVIIARRGHPVVRLQAILETDTPRKIGTLPGLLKQMPDDFDDSFDDWEETLA